MTREDIHNTRVFLRRILEDPQFLKEGELMSDEVPEAEDFADRILRLSFEAMEMGDPDAEVQVRSELGALVARVKELEAELEDASLEAKEEAERR